MLQWIVEDRQIEAIQILLDLTREAQERTSVARQSLEGRQADSDKDQA